MTKAEKWGHSIVSYPERGEGGSSNWRGNCNSLLIQEVLINFKPKHVKTIEEMDVLEIYAGSGTGKHACETLGIKNSMHLDLNPMWGGWNALKDEIPFGSDFVFSHPPYHDMVVYSGEMWGESHPDDLSRCASYDEFIHKMNIVNAKIYNSLRNGGKHAMLIGDMRRKGVYYSMIKDLVWYGDLEAHIIKEQHNTVSQRKKYANMNFVPIMHEHLLVFKKNDVWQVAVKVSRTEKRNLLNSKLVTWRDLVQSALQSLGGKATLNDIYQAVSKADKTKTNTNWEAKVRQTLQLGREFASENRGVWKLLRGSEMTAQTA